MDSSRSFKMFITWPGVIVTLKVHHIIPDGYKSTASISLLLITWQLLWLQIAGPVNIFHVWILSLVFSISIWRSLAPSLWSSLHHTNNYLSLLADRFWTAVTGQAPLDTSQQITSNKNEYSAELQFIFQLCLRHMSHLGELLISELKNFHFHAWIIASITHYF